jgi:hypothetical protein
MHDLPGWQVVSHSVVLGTAVVPESQIVRFPGPAHRELRPGDVLEQEAQDRVALPDRQVQDVGGEALVDEHSLAAGDRMGADGTGAPVATARLPPGAANRWGGKDLVKSWLV